jgi:hypothetical protein
MQRRTYVHCIGFLAISASDQQRIALLARKARYQAAIAEIEARWHCTIEEMRARYLAPNTEERSVDDDCVAWQWYVQAIETADAQLAVLGE